MPPWGWPGGFGGRGGGCWMAGWRGVGRCALAGHQPMGVSVGELGLGVFAAGGV